MPEIGDITLGRDIGKGDLIHKFIWTKCDKCGIERWVGYRPDRPSSLCLLCSRRKYFNPEDYGVTAFKGKNRRTEVIVVCPQCGESRLVTTRHGKPVSVVCIKCSIKTEKQNTGVHSPAFIRGGYEHKGYKFALLLPDDPLYCMGDYRHYVPEHRLVMARVMGRPLTKIEVVHHAGTKYPSDSPENKLDNLPENLTLFPNNSEHLRYEAKHKTK